MATSDFGDREAAISDLQKVRARTQPGSHEEAIGDRAIDYVLSQDRSDIASDFRVRAARRNAQFAHFRSVERNQRGLARLRTQEGAPAVSSHTGRPGARTGNRALTAAVPSAEDTVLAEQSDFCEQVLHMAAGISAQAVSFVRHLMSGDKAPEAAAAAGMSRAAGYRLLGTLRATVPHPLDARVVVA